jgi:hypothetical protein
MRWGAKASTRPAGPCRPQACLAAHSSIAVQKRADFPAFSRLFSLIPACREKKLFSAKPPPKLPLLTVKTIFQNIVDKFQNQICNAAALLKGFEWRVKSCIPSCHSSTEQGASITVVVCP